MVLRNDIGVMVSSNIDAYRIHLRKRKESEIYMKLIKQIPSEDGFYMPGEFEPHQGLSLIHIFKCGTLEGAQYKNVVLHHESAQGCIYASSIC